MYVPLAKLFGALLAEPQAVPAGHPIPLEYDRVYCFCTLCGQAWVRHGCSCHASWMRPLPDDLQPVADAAYRLGGYDAVRAIEDEAHERWVRRTPATGD